MNFSFSQGNGFISVVSGVAIVMTLCCISLDRYIAVTRPTRYRSIVTVKRACYALVVVWGQGFLYASFPFFGWSKYEYNEGTLHCSPKWTEDCSFYIYLAVVGFGIPISLMLFTYIRIFFVIRKHSRKVSTVRRAKVDLKKRESTCKSMPLRQQRQSADPNLTEGRMGASVEKISYSDEDQTIINSTMELSSFDHGCARAPTEKPRVLFVSQGEKCIISPEVASENTCTDSLSPQQQSIRATMGKMFRRYFPIKPRGGNCRALSRENKVAKTGVILLIIFIILWLPYMVVNICSARLKAPQIVFRFSMWLVFMNGVFNPIAYAFGNARVKMKFEQMFCSIFALCCKCRQIDGESVSLGLSESIRWETDLM